MSAKVGSDFGEPWVPCTYPEDGSPAAKDRHGNLVMLFTECTARDRAIACVNALAGTIDPQWPIDPKMWDNPYEY